MWSYGFWGVTNSEPEFVDTRIDTRAEGSISPVVDKEMNKSVDHEQVTEETMSIDDLLLQISDDLMLPSITVVELTKIRLGKGILVEDEPVRGNPAREMVELICRDVDFMVQLRDQVMVDVVNFFHSFSINKLTNFDALLALREKEKFMLEWAAKDSLETAVKRNMYILAKYKELLLRKIMESHRQFYNPGQPWTATASQIFDLLSDAHSKSLEDLLAQQREHGLPLAQPCRSPIIDSSIDSGAVLARFYSIANSTCWEVDSVEHDLLFALGPAIFPSVAQEERLYFVKSPESSPAISLHQESSSSSTDVSMHFDSTDIPVNAQADTQTSAPVDFTMFTDALEDLRSSIFQRIHDSNCEILSKVNAVELGVRGDLLKLQVLLHQSLENACRVLERQGTTQATQINDLKKGLMAPVGTIFQDLFDIKKKQREQDAKLIALDGKIAAIRSEQLDFQTKIAADILSLSTQVGDIADYIRGGDAKKGEIGSSSRPSTVRTQTFPPTTGHQRLELLQRELNRNGDTL
ncbi:hypothetical protein F511_28802 [Dorcoceras hygrometricum]|uniref:Uncharacterized protein n=1 Tax=Dorcoceras hygrometricum TaxID=472368 RepID=A0A2Z7BCJ4_9LAMI|nr:hypothetical protein F511_28802 [Dorcoceras hygrometricum]